MYNTSKWNWSSTTFELFPLSHRWFIDGALFLFHNQTEEEEEELEWVERRDDETEEEGDDVEDSTDPSDDDSEQEEDELPKRANVTRAELRSAQGRTMARYMDWSADPCDDFYQFACGNWDRHNRIPDDAAGFDTFEKLRDQLHLALRQLLQEPNVDGDSSAVVKARDLYASCMNLSEFLFVVLESNKEDWIS